MRHRKATSKLGSNSSHQRCLFANQLKSLINEEKIVTTLPKAKQLKRLAEKMITLAKKNDLAAKRRAKAKLMVRYNALTSKQARAAKEGDTSAHNDDRKVIGKLFDVLGPRFSKREGGYTRITKSKKRVGDNSQLCVIEYLAD